MTFTIMTFCALLLVVIRSVRWTGTNRDKLGFCMFVATLFFTIALSSVIFEREGYLYKNDTAQRMKYAVERTAQIGDRPFVVFVGGSHSFRGLIADEVQKQLKNDGLPHQVVDLTNGGMGLLEQDYHLEEYLKRIQRKPDVVFMEISKRFEDPLREYSRESIDDRMLPITDWSRYFWIVSHAMNIGNYTLLPHITKVMLLRVMNIGLLVKGEKWKDLPTLHQEMHHGVEMTIRKWKQVDAVKPEDVRAWAFFDFEELQPEKISKGKRAWLRDFRAYQARYLLAAGVEKVVYYPPPMMIEKYNAYARAICNDYRCFGMTDKNLQQKLNGPYWYNITHLNEAGARIYSVWLGKQLASYLKKH